MVVTSNDTHSFHRVIKTEAGEKLEELVSQLVVPSCYPDEGASRPIMTMDNFLASGELYANLVRSLGFDGEIDVLCRVPQSYYQIASVYQRSDLL